MNYERKGTCFFLFEQTNLQKNTKKEISSRAATTLENQDTFVQEVNKLNLRMNFMLNA